VNLGGRAEEKFWGEMGDGKMRFRASIILFNYFGLL